MPFKLKLSMSHQHGKKKTRSQFNNDEDNRLRTLVEKYGHYNWEQIAAEMPNRSVRQCRERWKHYLSGSKTDVPWTELEDKIILERVQILGGKWTKIAALLPGRTDLQVKNRWTQLFNNINRGPKRTLRDTDKTPPPVTTSIALPVSEDKEDGLFDGNSDGLPWDPLDWWNPL